MKDIEVISSLPDFPYFFFKKNGLVKHSNGGTIVRVHLCFGWEGEVTVELDGLATDGVWRGVGQHVELTRVCRVGDGKKDQRK